MDGATSGTVQKTVVKTKRSDITGTKTQTKIKKSNITESARKQDELRTQSKQLVAAVSGTANVKESRNKNNMQGQL